MVNTIFRILGIKGRITIPFTLRKILGIKTNDVLSFTLNGDTIIIKREKICSNCKNDRLDKQELLEFLTHLSPQERFEALTHLTVMWAQEQNKT